MLNARELASIRAEAERLLPDTCEIQRATRTTGGDGETVETWSTIATAACRVSPGRGPIEQEIGARLTSVNFWIVALPVPTDVRADDRVLVGSRTFEVVGVMGPRTNEISRRVACVEVA